jgi:hypothetical protein
VEQKEFNFVDNHFIRRFTLTVEENVLLIKIKIYNKNHFKVFQPAHFNRSYETHDKQKTNTLSD